MPDFCLAKLTLRNYAAPLVSAERCVAIDLELPSVDYTNPQAVQEAHQQISHMGLLDRFCDWAFHCGDKARGLDAFATLILYGDAERKGKTTRHIAQSREDAYRTLAECLSRTGQDALLDPPPGGTNEFTPYLSVADRRSLAGWVHVRHAHNLREPRVYAQGAAAFREAADEHCDAQRHTPAGEAYARAGDAHQCAGAFKATADMHDRAALSFLQGQQYRRAAQLYVQAAAGYVRLGLPGLAAATYASAGACYAQAGGADRYFALGAYQNSETTATLAKDLARAAASCGGIGHIYNSLAADQAHIGAHRRAAQFALSAAQAFERAGQHEESAAAYLTVAHAHKLTGEYDVAAQCAAQAATVYAAAGQHQQAAQSWGSASSLYARARRYDESETAFQAQKGAQCRAQPMLDAALSFASASAEASPLFD